MAKAPRGAGGAEATPDGGRWPRLEGHFERGLSLFRLTVIIPVIVLLLSALASFVYGTDVFIRSVTSFVEKPQQTSHNLGFLLLLTDLFLVGATLMIAAFGFYELFIGRIDANGPGMRLPGWLKMDDLNDLNARVIQMIMLVAAVSFTDVVVESKAGLEAFYLGAGVALVFAPLTACLGFGKYPPGRQPGRPDGPAGTSWPAGWSGTARSQRSSQPNCSASTGRTDSRAR